VPLPVIAALNAARVGVAATTTSTGTANRIARRTARPPGRGIRGRCRLTPIAPDASASTASQER